MVKLIENIDEMGNQLPNITGATLLSVEETTNYLSRDERRYNNWWWLRSPGDYANFAVDVGYCGDIHDIGDYVDSSSNCVRPALKIKNLKSPNLEIGDTFEINGYKFKVISDNLAWMHRQDIGKYPFNKSARNDYNTSDIKKFVDDWYNTEIKPYI